MQRTQIYLPKELRETIDKERQENGESLSEYLRNAAEEKVKKDQKRKVDLKKLADEIFTFGKKQAQNPDNKKKADEWVKQIREDRRLEDEHMEKRLNEATSPKSK